MKELNDADLRWAKGVARGMYGYLSHIDQLEGEAVYGLMQAAQRYDSSGGVAFRRYARYRIVGAMRDYLRKQPNLVGLYGIDPTAAEVKEEVKDSGRCVKNSAMSQRQMQVLRLLAAGKARKQIAYELGISKKSVDVYFQVAYKKLGVHNKILAVREARAQGILPLPEDAGARLDRAEAQLQIVAAEISKLRKELA